jgi:hypothetical protein
MLLKRQLAPSPTAFSPRNYISPTKDGLEDQSDIQKTINALPGGYRCNHLLQKNFAIGAAMTTTATTPVQHPSSP